MKKGLIALGCGLALLASYALSTPVFAEPRIANPKEIAMYEDMVRLYKAGHIVNASISLEEGDNTSALWHLERVLKEDNPDKEYKHNTIKYAPLKDIKKSVEEIADQNLKDKEIRGYLLDLAETIYEEEKIEIAFDKLKEVLSKETERHEGLGSMYEGIGSFFNHLWITYNLSLNESRSEEKAHGKILEKTHSKVRDVYRRKNPNNSSYINGLLEFIEKKIPKGDSELTKKIKSASSK